MFCIYLQLDGFRQVERISPATTDNLVASLDQILSRSGATLFKRDAGLFLYLFLRSREADHRQALATAFAVRDELERTGDELNGFTVVIEYLGAGDAVDVFRRLRQAASRFLEDRSIWIGPAAADSLAADVAGAENGLPQTLRAQLFYLAEFTMQHSAKVLAGRADAEVLVEINTAMMRGLRRDAPGR